MTGAPLPAQAFPPAAKAEPARPKWRRVLMRPSLLSLTAAAVGVSAIAHAMTVAGTQGPASSALPPTRMGVSIQQSLADRDRDLARRSRAATLREQSARAAEQRLKADLESSRSQPGVPAASATSEPTDAQQPLEDLAHIYQTMRPARAAPIFAALDLDVQTQIAKRMRERAVALIMANMDPDAAVRLSMALAGRRPVQPQVVPPAAPVAYSGMATPAFRDRGTAGLAVPRRAAAALNDGSALARQRAPIVAAPRLQAPVVQPITVGRNARPQVQSQGPTVANPASPAAAAAH